MSRRARIISSLFISIGFLLFSYWVTNLHLPISGEKILLTKLEVLHDYLWPRDNKIIDSVLFVNVTYDKELRPVYDKSPDGIDIAPAGRIPITDRHKLLKLLQYLQEKDDYKYILLDVFFGDDVKTEWDEALFSTIISMPRIVIPYHKDATIADERLIQKAGLADYLTTFLESDFVKFPYLCDTEQSIPVKMYEEITGRKIKKHGFFYTDGLYLVRSSIILTFDLLANETYVSDGVNDVKVWNNLGMDLLDDTIPEMDAIGDNLLYTIPEMTQNKYIVIGSFQGDDMHKTFLGEQSGAVIIFNAFISLLHRHHIVSIFLIIILFVTFFVLSYLTLSKMQLKDKLGELAKSSQNKMLRRCLKVLSWICSWVGFSFFLSVLCVITYVTLGETYDILITSTLFSFFYAIVISFDKVRFFIITLYNKIHTRIILLWNTRK